MKIRIRAELMLVVCTVIWGGTFPAVKYALTYSSPWLIVAVRFALAGILFTLVLIRTRQRISRQIFLRGFLLGLTFFAGFGLQTLGLQTTTSSRSAFLTEALVIIVPILSLIISHKLPTKYTVSGAVVVIGGLYMLTSPAGLLSLHTGDWLTLGCAIAFSFYIIGVDMWSRPENRLLLAATQAFTVALLALPIAIAGDLKLNATFGYYAAMLYLVIPGTFVVVLLQMRFQPLSTPSEAGVIFALEPVFAMIFALALTLEDFIFRAALGAMVVTLGVVWSELGSQIIGRIRRSRLLTPGREN
jgi:drug/metabolite transporter (DMT)-like permease